MYSISDWIIGLSSLMLKMLLKLIFSRISALERTCPWALASGTKIEFV
jgi:hypothetical protein